MMLRGLKKMIGAMALGVTAAFAGTGVMAQGMDWSGPYAGVQLNYMIEVDGTTGRDGDGPLGGVHGGFRWDDGPYVVGLEAAFNAGEISLQNGRSVTTQYDGKFKIGAELGALLVSGVAGISVLGTDFGHAEGYLYGVSGDYAINDRFSVGAEILGYNFHRFGQPTARFADPGATGVAAGLRASFRF